MQKCEVFLGSRLKINTFVATIAWVFFVLCTSCSVAWADTTSCHVCHNVMSGKATAASGQEIDLRVNTQEYQASVHGFMPCTACHLAFEENPHSEPVGDVDDEILQLSEKIKHKAKIDEVAYSACNLCHGEIYSTVLSSVHGRNIAEKGETDGALCLDCHGSPHNILKADVENSSVNRSRMIEICGACHSKEYMIEKYGIEPNVMASYAESFHGKKFTLGHKRAPTCVSCHGYHDIKSKDNPTSPVVGSNKLQTCGNCHDGANETFVAAITHKPAGPIPHYAEKALILLLISVIAFTIIHVLLEAFSDIRDAIFRRNVEGNKPEEQPKNLPKEVERFNIIFRIQHVVMFSTFLLLAFTGWGIKYAEIDMSSSWIRIWGGPEMAGKLHRIAGITMVIDFLFHVGYLGYLYSKGKLKFRKETTIIPLPSDVVNVVRNFLYFLGISKTKPKFGKFNYSQKLDYWAVFWGMFIIGLSGLALAFPIAATLLIPNWGTGWIWHLIGLLHSDEALLAIVFILFWHFYNEHLKPEVFPMSRIWITGKISVKDLKKKHSLEYDLLFPPKDDNDSKGG